jgi:hypothetical protein
VTRYCSIATIASNPLSSTILKGKIFDITVYNDRARFDVWLDRSVTAIDVEGYELEYVGDSTVRFDVYQRGDSDDDDESFDSAVPFQVAYAVAIHKAQGLEYDSVKWRVPVSESTRF